MLTYKGSKTLEEPLCGLIKCTNIQNCFFTKPGKAKKLITPMMVIYDDST